MRARDIHIVFVQLTFAGQTHSTNSMSETEALNVTALWAMSVQALSALNVLFSNESVAGGSVWPYYCLKGSEITIVDVLSSFLLSIDFSYYIYYIYTCIIYLYIIYYILYL